MSIDTSISFAPFPSMETGYIKLNFPDGKGQSNNITNRFLGDCKVVLGDKNAANTIFLDFNVLNKWSQTIYYSMESENLLIEAIRNLVRLRNFSELNQSFENGDISDHDFNFHLEQNEDKYLVTTREDVSGNQVEIICHLMEKIGYNLRDFSTSDISEMFSVDESLLIEHVKRIQNIY